ncbi:hypothetical protein LARV_01518 [Longilinea arvoryzae]|uniref:Uncharacterized protein n=1 Tax=Longilinea arvoryzae TaxID=360412 RepID=A0A0S7BGT3_9CHLR|nr:lysylphosphatidylglycerol synthase domain-containing protein [Longilinea arvoryzae]GAP13763.1 hypothetical protein LARV_01518 [Longilinea arvoryzae]
MNIKTLIKIINTKWLKFALQIIIFLFCGWYIWKNLQQLDFGSLSINYWWMILSLLITMIGTFLGAVSWLLTLLSFGQKLTFSKICDIQFKSSLAKYIPGYGWQLVGKGYMSINAGIPASITGISIIFEYIEIFITGVFLMAFFYPHGIDFQIPIIRSISNNIHLLQIVSIFLLVCAPIILIRFLKMLYQKEQKIDFEWKWTILLVGLMVMTWIINSFGFYQMFFAISVYKKMSFQLTIFFLTLTFLIGLIIIVVPGSIGVREAIFIFLLSPFIGVSQAGLIAIFYRIITIASEVLVLFLSNIWQHFHKNILLTENNS